MKTIHLIIIVLTLSIFSYTGLFAQQEEITLTFQGQDVNTQNSIPLDSVLVENLTVGCDTMLYGEIPTLKLLWTIGINENYLSTIPDIKVHKISPNPFSHKTTVSLIVYKSTHINISLLDCLGNSIASIDKEFFSGTQSFEIQTPIAGIYLLNFETSKSALAVKLISNQKENLHNPDIIHLGRKESFLKNGLQNGGFIFYPGNYLAITAHATGYEQKMIFDYPNENHTYIIALEPSPIVPTAITLPITDSTHYSATCSGIITESGSNAVLGRGVCWSALPNPTIDNNFTNEGEGLGEFTSYIDNLEDSTTYFVRAYGYNSKGVGYGNQVSFTTIDVNTPTVSTIPIIKKSSSNAVSGGLINDDGGIDVTERGICWSETENPDIGDNHTENGTGSGTYTSLIDNLNPNTTYFVRAYAINEEGTAYGNQIQFCTPGPCDSIPEVFYQGQVYNTIEIGNQCWFKENMNVGEKIPGSWPMTNNGVIEKYCYNNQQDSCIKYGGLYKWDEIMNYNTLSGAQGICPDEWHIPTDEEWKILEGNADSQFPVGDEEWDNTGWRGEDVGYNLKSSNGWLENGVDLFGFTALPGGYKTEYPTFGEIGASGIWWTSENSFARKFEYNQTKSARSSSVNSQFSYSIRCIKDENTFEPEASFSSSPNSGSAPLTVSFFDESSKEPENWFWDFGDGNTSTDINPVHTFMNPGNYTVKLQTSNTFGSDTETKEFYISVAIDEHCPGLETITYGGQSYNTILIGNQCWLKENLNIGTIISGNMDMTNNDTIEKYCYEDNPEYCEVYGGLYQWNEAMQYTFQPGTQGLCPGGWHIPLDEEWMVLESTIDSRYQPGDSIWNNLGTRGYDVGLNMKTTVWEFGKNLFGFEALPAGYTNWFHSYAFLGEATAWWTSNPWADFDALSRHLYSFGHGLSRENFAKGTGLSVRCIKDNDGNAPNANFTANQTIGISPLTVSFSDLSENFPTGWFWNFGDGSASTINNPQHTYLLPGQYTVELIVSNPFGTDTLVKVNYLTIEEPADDTITPCPGLETISHGGQVYNTILIGNQCWLKENLNIGTMIPGNVNMQYNELIEKYCYNNDTSNCSIYGGLYQWNEMMQYSNQLGTQGICPDSWHIPTDQEWKMLEAYADSLFEIGDPEWNNTGWRGHDSGKNLKTSDGWHLNGDGTDQYEFSGMPGGLRTRHLEHFYNQSKNGYWWSSDEALSTEAWERELSYGNDQIHRDFSNKKSGFSVRCIKDQ